MKKKKNAGFSMVEILISLTIFAILLIPIISGIVSSLKMSSNSKELQYRNDFAENLMEHIKAVSTIDEVLSKDYYVKNGTIDSSFTTEAPASTDVWVDTDGDHVDDTKLQKTKCAIKGQTKLGTQKTVYNYKVEIDNSYYVDKKAADTTFVDPNNLALGIVEDIDYRKVALIDGTILNYDKTAVTSFKTRKLQYLKEEDEEQYQQQMQGILTDRFEADTASRLTTIEVSGDETTGYTVRCLLDYFDNNSILKGDNHIQYVPYASTFSSELPNIYLMYNPCVYNNNYSSDDYIILDTSGLKSSTQEVNVFVVEVAYTFSENIREANSLTDAQKNRPLYNDVAAGGTSRNDVNIHMVAATKRTTGSTDFLNQIHIYHNIGDNENADASPKINSKSSKNKFWYKADAAITTDEKSAGIKASMDTTLGALMDKLNDGLPAGDQRVIVPLVPGGTGNTATVGLLNTAEEESRGLYQVKIWLKQASEGEIDSSSELPILQGTKGGNET